MLMVLLPVCLRRLGAAPARFAPEFVQAAGLPGRVAAHGSRAVTPLWPLCLGALSGSGQRTDEIARVGGGSLECLVSRIGTVRGALDLDHLDVGHAEKAEHVF